MSEQYNVPALTELTVGQTAYTDGDFVRGEATAYYKIPVTVVRSRTTDSYHRYDIEYR